MKSKESEFSLYFYCFIFQHLMEKETYLSSTIQLYIYNLYYIDLYTKFEFSFSFQQKSFLNVCVCVKVLSKKNNQKRLKKPKNQNKKEATVKQKEKDERTSKISLLSSSVAGNGAWMREKNVMKTRARKQM